VSQSRRIICGVAGETYRDHHAQTVVRPSRSEALAFGVAVGFLAGVVWVWTPGTFIGGWRSLPSVRRELLAASVHPGVTFLHPRHRDRDATLPTLLTRDALHRASDEPSAAAEPPRDPQRDMDSAPGQHSCALGMRLVDGEYCAVVARSCLEPFTDGSGRCRRFANAYRCYPPLLPLRFCIDEFEYPNRRGEKPAVMVTFEEAQKACQAEGKRLCTAREWTLACEGPERLPYPNGLVRDATACNVDLPHRFPDTNALNDPTSRARELARLDQRTPSGSRPACASAFGVEDLVGNVDEWVVPDGPEEAAGFGASTALKGGYFGPVRARCRPSTPSHGPTFSFYQVGFRCCRAAR
jgi:hypothetical protein